MVHKKNTSGGFLIQKPCLIHFIWYEPYFRRSRIVRATVNALPRRLKALHSCSLAKNGPILRLAVFQLQFWQTAYLDWNLFHALSTKIRFFYGRIRNIRNKEYTCSVYLFLRLHSAALPEIGSG